MSALGILLRFTSGLKRPKKDSRGLPFRSQQRALKMHYTAAKTWQRYGRGYFFSYILCRTLLFANAGAKLGRSFNAFLQAPAARSLSPIAP